MGWKMAVFAWKLKIFMSLKYWKRIFAPIKHQNRPSTVLATINFLGILNFFINKTNYRESYRFLKSEKPNNRGTRKFSYKRVPQKFSKIFKTNATIYKQPWGWFWTLNKII